MDTNDDRVMKEEQLEKLLFSAEEAHDGPQDTGSRDGHAVWLGNSITEAELGAFTAKSPARVVFIAGMPNSGKTTLLAALYQAFLNGPLENVRFAGSRTLPRFENISFYARIESERMTPATKRTNFSDEVEFVHLDLERLPTGGRFNLFLTDISGEAFEHVRNSVQDAARFVVARYADYFCLLIDAAKLSRLDTRHEAARDVQLIVDSFIRQNLITAGCVVQIAISRVDLIPPDDTNVDAFIESVVCKLVKVISAMDVRVQRFNLAARPPQGASIGLEALFNAWFEDDQPDRPNIPQFGPYTGKDDFGMSTAPGNLLR